MLGEHRDEGVVHLLQRDSIEHQKISGTQMPPYQCLKRPGFSGGGFI